MRHSRNIPEPIADSMADIAFLLLIFFLQSANIPNNYEIQRTLPPHCSEGQVVRRELK